MKLTSTDLYSPTPEEHPAEGRVLHIGPWNMCVKKGHTEKQNFQWYSMEGLTIYWETS